MCKEKTNKRKLVIAEKKIVDEEIKEAIRSIDNWKFHIVAEKIKKELKLL